jgi:UDP-2,3-diacylglucosamine pyrophosphatase LpxH
MPTEPIVILSDLHVAHPLSLVRGPDEIAGLLPEGGTVIFNGDSVEMRSHLDRDSGRENRDRLRALCEARGNRVIFLTGNHDPLVSDLHHLDLCAGQVLVTHGDILFHDCSPWSHEGSKIGAEHTRLLDALAPADRADLDTRLRIAKQAAQVMERHYTARQSIISVARNILLEVIPPWRPLCILKFWGQAPGLGAALLKEFRPEARLLVVGHLHHAGVWHLGDRTVINTGCYFPVVGRRMVRIANGRLDVLNIRGPIGGWRPGRTVFSTAVA